MEQHTKAKAVQLLRERFRRAQKHRHVPKGVKFRYKTRPRKSRTMPAEVLAVTPDGLEYSGLSGGVGFVPRGYKPPKPTRRAAAPAAATRSPSGVAVKTGVPDTPAGDEGDPNALDEMRAAEGRTHSPGEPSGAGTTTPPDQTT